MENYNAFEEYGTKTFQVFIMILKAPSGDFTQNQYLAISFL